MTGPVEERTYRWPRRYVFTVTLAVIMGSDCVSVMLAVMLMLLSPPPLAAKMALRSCVSVETSTAQAGASVSAVAVSRAAANLVTRGVADSRRLSPKAACRRRAAVGDGWPSHAWSSRSAVRVRAPEPAPLR